MIGLRMIHPSLSSLSTGTCNVILPSHKSYVFPLSSPSLLSLSPLLSAFLSPPQDFLEGTYFQRLIPEAHSETLKGDDEIRRVVMCTGKLYYELLSEREKKGVDDVAIVRVEQISPFPFDKVAEEMARYSNAELVWAQEEPKNMGCWTYVQDRMMTATRILNKSEVRPAYVGRQTEASPAVGYVKLTMH